MIIVNTEDDWAVHGAAEWPGPQYSLLQYTRRLSGGDTWSNQTTFFSEKVTLAFSI